MFATGWRFCSGLFHDACLPRLVAPLLFAIVGLAATEPVQAQTAVDALRFTQRAPAVGDARALGRGGVGRAGTGAVTALYYNPAGLGWLETSEASGAFAIIGTEGEARFQAGDRDPTRQSADVTDYGGHFGLAYKVPTQRGSLVFAGSYNRVSTFGHEFTFTGLNSGSSITDTFLPERRAYTVDGGIPSPDSDLAFAAYEAGAIDYDADFDARGEYPFFQAVPGGTAIQQGATVTEQGHLNEVSLGTSAAVAPNVMLGLSANIAFGEYRFANNYTETDANDEIGPDDYFLATDPDLAGLDQLTFGERFTSEISGINLRGGFSAEAAPGVRLGLTVETPTFYQISESFTLAEITTFFDNGGSLSYGGQSGDVGVGENEYEVRTPWHLGAGVQASLLELTDGVADLTLSADVEFVDWSQLELSSEDFSLDDQNQVAEEDFEAVFNTNLGAELKLGGAVLRAGFASRPDPIEGEYELENGETTDASRTTFSAGTGYRFTNDLQVDVAWMQTRLDEQYRPYASLDGVPGTGAEIVAPFVDQDITRNRFLVGVRYLF